MEVLQILIKTTNVDLFTIGVTIAAIGLLGFIVYVHDKSSATNRTLAVFSFLTIIYGVINYLNYQFVPESYVLILLRLTIFTAVLHAFSFFHLTYVFPQKTKEAPLYYYFISIFVIGVAVLTLTPFVFTGIEQYTPTGTVSQASLGPGIILFALTTLTLIACGLWQLIKKTYKANGASRAQLYYVLIGSTITFSLLILFNVILPVVFEIVRYIPLAPVFFFPFIGLTTYSIIKLHLFGIKAITTAILTFTLAIVSVVEIVLAENLFEYILRISIFFLILVFGAFLIQSVINEVQQREEIERLAEDLKKANVRLKALDKSKTEFVSIASHQLRSPLSAIKGYASMLLEGSFGKISIGAREAVGRIFTSSSFMVNSVNDFLNISRIELGRMKYDMKSFDISKMIDAVVEEQRPFAKEKNLTIDFKREKDVKICEIYADPGKIRQVLANLIDNAVKYTLKGSITLRLVPDEEKKTVTITITDTGVGMSKETIGKLFEKFSRADNANDTNVMGTGLGLFVAGNLIKNQGGKIWVTSEGEGKGSTFHVELPFKATVPEIPKTV